MLKYLESLIKQNSNDNYEIIKNFLFEYLNHINENILLFFSTTKINQVNFLNSIRETIQNQSLFITSNKEQHLKKITRLGDLHNGGKCTCLFESEKDKYIFKPINPAPILFLNKVLSSFNDTGLFDFYLLPISLANQGIKVKYLSNSFCQDIKSFSYHYGGLIFILTLLRGIDFHEDNVFCVNSKPVIIDCESLFYPIIKDTKPYNTSATLLLPTKYPLSYKYLRKGIFSAYKATVNLQCFLEKEIESNLIDMKIRLIFKPTRYYYNVLKNSTHPAFLLNNIDRVKYIKNCLAGKREISKTIFSSELNDLINLDIPYFYLKENELFNSTNTPLSQNFLFSSKFEIQNNFQNLDFFTSTLLNYMSEK